MFALGKVKRPQNLMKRPWNCKEGSADLKGYDPCRSERDYNVVEFVRDQAQCLFKQVERLVKLGAMFI